MNIASVTLSVLLVGLPAFAGGYLIVRYFGHKRLSSGISMLIFAIAMGGGLALLLPEGRLSGGTYLFTAPGALVIFIILGAVFGFLSKRRGNGS